MFLYQIDFKNLKILFSLIAEKLVFSICQEVDFFSTLKRQYLYEFSKNQRYAMDFLAIGLYSLKSIADTSDSDVIVCKWLDTFFTIVDIQDHLLPELKQLMEQVLPLQRIFTTISRHLDEYSKSPIHHADIANRIVFFSNLLLLFHEQIKQLNQTTICQSLFALNGIMVSFPDLMPEIISSFNSRRFYNQVDVVIMHVFLLTFFLLPCPSCFLLFHFYFYF